LQSIPLKAITSTSRYSFIGILSSCPPGALMVWSFDCGLVASECQRLTGKPHERSNSGSFMMSWQVYLLRCSDDSLYCGVTTDVDRRLHKHNQGVGSRYTRSRLPVRVVWSSCELIK
jgi:hypothetical protein